MREFKIAKAYRERVPLLIGLYGPSGSGKTRSALRLATGAQRVCGGLIGGLDSEAKRMKAYAPARGQAADPASGTYDFVHVELDAPFDPDSYLQALRFLREQGVTCAVVDSTSHMHEGHGGILEWHEAELARMGGSEKNNFAAWIKPKRALNSFLGDLMRLDFGAMIFCFRAKEKLKIIPGKNPVNLGWMPIQADEFAYEMTVNALLPPGSQGVPLWKSREPGEELMIKLPGQFQQLLTSGRPFDEDMGEALARWAAGGSAPGKAPVFAKSFPDYGGQPFTAVNVEVVGLYIDWLKEKREDKDPRVAQNAERMYREANAYYDAAIEAAIDASKTQAL